MNHWVMKSEPTEYSIVDLKRDKHTMWDGVRNYQVRNMMRDDMQVGDLALFYHSNAGAETGITGVMEITRTGYTDPTQFEPDNIHYDPKSTSANPRWLAVDVKFIEQLPRMVTLEELKGRKALVELTVVQRGNRLSITPLSKRHFDIIVAMASE